MMPDDDLNLFIKCLGMLGSDHEGEAANARAKCNRLLKKHKLTWADVPKLQAAAGASNAGPSQEGRERQERQGREAAAREAAEETARAKQAYEDARRREEAVSRKAAEAAEAARKAERKAAKERRKAVWKSAAITVVVAGSVKGAFVLAMKEPTKPVDAWGVASFTPAPPKPPTLEPVNGDPFAKANAVLSFDHVKNDQFRSSQYVQPVDVALPNGTIISFPAGMTGDAIVAAIEKTFPDLAPPTPAPAPPAPPFVVPPSTPLAAAEDQCTPAALKLREAGSLNTCPVLNKLAQKECVVTLVRDYGKEKKGGSFQAVNYKRHANGELEICSRSGGCVPKQIVNSITACPNEIPTVQDTASGTSERKNGPYEVKVDSPICETVIVAKVFFHDKDCDDGSYGQGRPQDGDSLGCYGSGASGISYVGGKGQDGGYAVVPAMENSRPGDRVRLCLVSYMANCPPGDSRGKFYSALNLRTRGAWMKADSMHMCGGA
jgi:hypothetical protein